MEHYERGFLNKRQGTAFYEMKVSYENNEGRNSHYQYIAAEVSIADCSRRITLDFSVDDEKDWGNNISKLDLLMAALREFRQKYSEAKSEYNDDKAAYKAARAAEKEALDAVEE